MQNSLHLKMLENRNRNLTANWSSTLGFSWRDSICLGSESPVSNHMASFFLLFCLRWVTHSWGNLAQILHEIHGIPLLLMGKGNLQHNDLHILLANSDSAFLSNPSSSLLLCTWDCSDSPWMHFQED